MEQVMQSAEEWRLLSYSHDKGIYYSYCNTRTAGIDRWDLYSQLSSKLKIYFKNKLLFEWLIQNQMDYRKILYVIIFTVGTQTTYIYFLTESGKVLTHLFFLLFWWFKIWKRDQ